ncbi:hypothetical protein T11_707 [Trichinella zimbabwensis]|uniref:Uncharacterized protein n=1 Tax=Trichinella zimbabwensis TaxID=268475 RepID=A0A0V1I887_9BILA|nr:hypothetical protein T11_707 [Trichinella zimbabwensis]
MENELPKFCSFVKIASVITLKCVEIYSVANHVALYLNSGYGTYGSKIGSYPCTFVSVSKLSSSLNKVCDSTGLSCFVSRSEAKMSRIEIQRRRKYRILCGT